MEDNSKISIQAWYKVSLVHFSSWHFPREMICTTAASQSRDLDQSPRSTASRLEPTWKDTWRDTLFMEVWSRRLHLARMAIWSKQSAWMKGVCLSFGS